MSEILSPVSAQRLADRLRRNTLFASAVALNRSANLVQGIMRQSMRRNFTIRRGDFIDRHVFGRIDTTRYRNHYERQDLDCDCTQAGNGH